MNNKDLSTASLRQLYNNGETLIEGGQDEEAYEIFRRVALAIEGHDCAADPTFSQLYFHLKTLERLP